MKSNYRIIGDLIQLVDERNKELKVKTLLGLSISKQFIPSVANTVGTNMRNYKIIRKNQFACSIMQVRRDKKMPVALLQDFEEAIISQAYPVFEAKDKEEILPEYLMMWMSRSEFDRHACFLAVGGVRGSLEWEDFCNMELPVPSIEKQRAIVKEYNTIVHRIQLNEQLNQKLEATAQALYKHWFVDFEFPDENGKPYKSNGGKMLWNEELEKEIPEGWSYISLSKITSKIGSGSTPKGGKDSYKESGISLIRSLNVHDFNFIYDDLAFINDVQAKKLSNVEIKENDVLLNITGASVGRCCMVPSNVLPARVNQHVMIIRIKEEVNYAFNLLCALCSFENKSELLGISQSGSTRQAITKTEVEDFKITFADKRVRNDFEKKMKFVFEAKNNLSRQNQVLNALCSILLSRLSIEFSNKEDLVSA